MNLVIRKRVLKHTEHIGVRKLSGQGMKETKPARVQDSSRDSFLPFI